MVTVTGLPRSVNVSISLVTKNVDGPALPEAMVHPVMSILMPPAPLLPGSCRPCRCSHPAIVASPVLSASNSTHPPEATELCPADARIVAVRRDSDLPQGVAAVGTSRSAEEALRDHDGSYNRGNEEHALLHVPLGLVGWWVSPGMNPIVRGGRRARPKWVGRWGNHVSRADPKRVLMRNATCRSRRSLSRGHPRSRTTRPGGPTPCAPEGYGARPTLVAGWGTLRHPTQPESRPPPRRSVQSIRCRR